MPISKQSLLKKAKKIRLLAMDVDGVLTRGEIVVLESGEEVKFWNAKDRLGLAVIRKHNMPLLLAWITGRESRAVLDAANDLGVPFVVQKCGDKKTALEKICQKAGVAKDQAAFIGDDLIDLPVLNNVGLSVCPKDAVSDVKKRVHYVSPLKGGEGVVRDVLEIVLKAQGQWDQLVSSFLS